MANDRSLVNYVEFSKLLHQIQFPMTVAEIHGLVTGLIIGEKDEGKRMGLLYELTNEGESYSHVLREAVMGMSHATLKALSSEDFSFELLVPDDSQSVFDRVDALGEWVNHFLLGLGVTRVDIATSDDESKEIFNDFREIAKLGYELEEDEKALAADLENIMEYVKVSVLIYYDKFYHEAEVTKKKRQAMNVESITTTGNKTLH